jgi:two-component system sensor histidine kinase RegB
MAARATSTDAEDLVSIDELAGELRRQLGDRGAAVDVEVAGAEDKLALPASLVVQSVGALIKNALDASQPDARVKLEIRRDPRALSFAVRDRGAGIPEDVLSRVGDPFFTTKPPGRGLGLGVFLARVFFESRGGELTIESTAGVGTQARARIPITASPG